MKYICPLIVVENIKKSREFYQKVLGQKVKFDFGENITFEGDFSIHLKTHFQKLIQNKEIKKGTNNFELYFEENHLEGIQDKLKELKMEFIHDIAEQPWRQRVLRFYDYDKNIIEIGESLEYTAYRLSRENLSIGEISKITYLPEEKVTESIKKFSG